MVLLVGHRIVSRSLPRRIIFQGLNLVASRGHHNKTSKNEFLFKSNKVPTSALLTRHSSCPVPAVNLGSGFHTTPARHEIVQFHLSDIGEGIKEVTIKEWFVKPGSVISQFDQICEVQSDKASVTITSRYDGVVKKVHFEVDQVAQTGDALVDIELTGSGGDHASTVASNEVEVQETEAINVGSSEDEIPSNKAHVRVLATPAVRRMSAEFNIDLNNISGTGRDGRVLKEDVINYIESQAQAKKMAAAAPAQQAAKPTAQPSKPPPRPPAPKPVIVSGEDKTEPIKGIMKAMTKIMTESLTIPHFGYCDAFDIGRLVELRSELKKSVEIRSGGAVKLSYMPFIIKACSLALLQYPVLNSHFDAKKEVITYKANHNIGVAMDTAQGLLVPVVKQVQGLSVYEIAIELNRLQDLGLKGKLSEADLTVATFALSNIGSIGGTYAKPVIVPPQVAIGAIGRVQVLPRFAKDGSIVKAHVINISWSADHRVLDGATVARFSNLMKNYLEIPASMTLDLH